MEQKLIGRQIVWRELKRNLAAYMASVIDRIKKEREHENP